MRSFWSLVVIGCLLHQSVRSAALMQFPIPFSSRVRKKTPSIGLLSSSGLMFHEDFF